MQTVISAFKNLYKLFKWSVTPTAREVRISQWLYESYFDWSEPPPNAVTQNDARSRDIGS